MTMIVIMATLIVATWIGMAIILFKTNFLDDKNDSVK
jgi:hypothetical protein